MSGSSQVSNLLDLVKESGQNHSFVNNCFIVDDIFHSYWPSQTSLDQFKIAKRTCYCYSAYNRYDVKEIYF